MGWDLGGRQDRALIGSKLPRNTQRIVLEVDQVLIDQPGVDGDIVRHKTGHRALDDGAVATDDVLQVDVRLIHLVHHCKQTKGPVDSEPNVSLLLFLFCFQMEGSGRDRECKHHKLKKQTVPGRGIP